MTASFVAPFPWFGGKRAVAGEVWARFGDVANYVEPFFGSGAVLLGRPGWTPGAPWIETINDRDGFVANFWRALQADPAEVTRYADWPVNENDLHARHSWLVARRAELQARMDGDPDYFDAKIAGWWLWGICLWIGGGWCSGNGPWQVVDGQLVHLGNAGRGVKRQLVHLGDAGRGVKRKLVHLGDAGMGVNRQRVHLGNAGMGVNRQRVHLGNVGMGDAGDGSLGMAEWLAALSERLRRVRVCSGDWTRVCGPTPTFKNGLTGVFLDPPYSSEAGRDEKIYATEDLTVAHSVRAWCRANGANPLLRIALCGYRGEHDDLEAAGWEALPWKAKGGYGSRGNGSGRENSEREVIWFSPHCLKIERQPQTLALPLEFK